MILDELHRKHNLILERWIRSDLDGAERHYRGLAFRYYSLIEEKQREERERERLSHQRAS